MKIRISLLIIFLTTAIANAQVTSTALDDFLKSGKKNESKSFAKLNEYLIKNNLEFDNSQEVVKLFNEERIRLGANFESELWNYLENDLNKHYWINLFVEIEDYLDGNSALPDLGMRIREKSQDIRVEKDDISGLGMKFTMLRKLTVDYYLKGKLDLANTTKKKSGVMTR